MMKKIFCACLCAAMLLVCAVSAEDGAGFSFEALNGLVFEHSSGAGAWSVELTIAPDGTFTGNYHDSEIGDSGEEYPNGTMYTCLFHGSLSVQESLSATALRLKVEDLSLDAGQSLQTIADGVRYLLSPIDLRAGDMLTLYLPGQPTAELSADFLLWMHLGADDGGALPFYALREDADDDGYVGIDYSALPDLPVSLPAEPDAV